MDKEIVCIMCPLGGSMTVHVEGKKVGDVQGNKCKKGIKHAESEVFFPARILTTTIRTDSADAPLLPVRSDKPIPKDRLMDCVGCISERSAKGPIKLGQIIIENILGVDANIVACRSYPLEIPNTKTR